MSKAMDVAKRPVKRATLGEEADAVARPVMRPAQCRADMRRELAREFPEIVQGFVKSAKRGSCQHLKLATEFLDAKKKPEPMRSGRNTLKRLVRRMQEIQD